MRILLVTTVSNTFRFLNNDISALKKLGYSIDVATHIKKPIDDSLLMNIDNVFNVRFDRNPFSTNNIYAYSEIKKLIKSNRYDAIHTHTPIASFITRFASRKKNSIKIIYTAHGFHFFEGAPIKNWLLFYPIEKIAIKWTDLIITINKEDYKLARKLAVNSDCKVSKVSGVGLDTELFFGNTPVGFKSKQLKLSDNKFILTFIGEMNDNKNQILLLEIMKTLKFNKPNYHLLLVGTGKNTEVYREFIDNNNLDNVSMLGYRNDVANILSITDIYLSSSKREGLPVNVMEAMASGLPVIATNIRGHKDLIQDNVNGYLIEGKKKKFIEKIIHLEEHKDLRRKFSKNGLNIIKSYDDEFVFIESLNNYRCILK